MGAVLMAALGWGWNGAQAAPPLLTADGKLNAEWHFVGLPQQKKPLTRFDAERVDGHEGLRIDADQSYGNWVHTYPQPTVVKRMRWAWRVDSRNEKTVLTQREGDDVAARVCVSFDMPLSRLSFMERQKLALARSVSGMEIAPATLCYVWGAHEARGAVFDSIFTRRMRQIVLRNHDDAVHAWFEEDRDVVADFLRVFGDETKESALATALIIGADADNTHLHTVAHVADLRTVP